MLHNTSPDKRHFPSDPDNKESKGIKDPEIVAIYLSDSNHIVIPVSIQGWIIQEVLDSGINTCLMNREINKTLNPKSFGMFLWEEGVKVWHKVMKLMGNAGVFHSISMPCICCNHEWWFPFRYRFYGSHLMYMIASEFCVRMGWDMQRKSQLHSKG